MAKLSATIVIPTYERPQDLGRCLKSILEQRRLPDEIILVDDGNLEAFPLKDIFESRGIRCVYIQKTNPGLTRSKALGSSMADGDIVHILDDDVELEPEYLEIIQRSFEEDTEQKIGGIGGMPVSPHRKPLRDSLRFFYDLVFLNNWFIEGTVLPSGFSADYGTTPFPLRRTRQVDFIVGCATAVRRHVFAEVPFREDAHELGYYEDKDFSWRVGRKWKLLMEPRARLIHRESMSMRPDKEKMGRRFVVGMYLFFRDYIDRSVFHKMCFWYALLGYFLFRTGVMVARLRRSDMDRVKGILTGVRNILRGELPTLPFIDPAQVSRRK